MSSLFWGRGYRSDCTQAFLQIIHIGADFIKQLLQSVSLILLGMAVVNLLLLERSITYYSVWVQQVSPTTFNPLSHSLFILSNPGNSLSIHYFCKQEKILLRIERLLESRLNLFCVGIVLSFKYPLPSQCAIYTQSNQVYIIRKPPNSEVSTIKFSKYSNVKKMKQQFYATILSIHECKGVL